VPATLAGFVVASLSTIATPLLSVSVATINAPAVLPPSSSAPMVPSYTILVTTLPSLSSRPHVSLDHFVHL